MKSALALTLMVCLVGSAVPVTAQERIDRTAGPISRSLAPEGVRLAAESAAADASQQTTQSTNAAWARVRELQPGTEITVTVKGSEPGTRYVLSADESALTVLNLTDPALPAVAREVLRDLASYIPAKLIDTQKGGTLLLGKNVRLDRNSVFVADQKVADLGQVVESIAQPQVVEVRRPSHGHHSSVGKSVLIGTAIGLAAGLAWGGSKGCTRGCDDPGLGLVVGGSFGLGFGAAGGMAAGLAKASRHGDQTIVIYRAP